MHRNVTVGFSGIDVMQTVLDIDYVLRSIQYCVFVLTQIDVSYEVF